MHLSSCWNVSHFPLRDSIQNLKWEVLYIECLRLKPHVILYNNFHTRESFEAADVKITYHSVFLQEASLWCFWLVRTAVYAVLSKGCTSTMSQTWMSTRERSLSWWEQHQCSFISTTLKAFVLIFIAKVFQ